MALFFSSLSFSFVVLRTDPLVEGLSSSTRAVTRLRLMFAASFLFPSAFLFCCFDPSVSQCCLSNEIYAGTLICSSLLLAFRSVTLLDYNFIFFELRLLVYVALCDFLVSVGFATIYIDSNDNIFKKCSLCVCSCSLFRRWLQQLNVTRNCSLHVSAISMR